MNHSPFYSSASGGTGISYKFLTTSSVIAFTLLLPHPHSPAWGPLVYLSSGFQRVFPNQQNQHGLEI